VWREKRPQYLASSFTKQIERPACAKQRAHRHHLLQAVQGTNQPTSPPSHRRPRIAGAAKHGAKERGTASHHRRRGQSLRARRYAPPMRRHGHIGASGGGAALPARPAAAPRPPWHLAPLGMATRSWALLRPAHAGPGVTGGRVRVTGEAVLFPTENPPCPKAALQRAAHLPHRRHVGSATVCA